jgi:hypothetical protein
MWTRNGIPRNHGPDNLNCKLSFSSNRVVRKIAVNTPPAMRACGFMLMGKVEKDGL